MRDRRRFIAVADEPGDAYGRVDRAPALRRQIDCDEEIARKQRRRDGFNATCMPPPLEVTRKIDFETLPVEMRGRLAFRVRMGMSDEPPRPQFGCHVTFSIARSRRNPS